MDPWTAANREAFVKEAVESKELKGRRGPYFFNVMPKVTSANTVEEDPRRGLLTDTVSAVIYGNPTYRGIALRFYELLIQKMLAHPMLAGHLYHNLVVLIKGSNAHMYFVGDRPEAADLFRYSDLDITVCINPFLPDGVFHDIMVQVEIVVKQAISQYKRTLDHMLFLGRPIDAAFLPPAVCAEFKKAVSEATKMAGGSEEAPEWEFVSPFENDDFRNTASRNSFLLTNSLGHENSVVRVEVPHFYMCERIPLRKTPLFCSFNETIDFDRAAGEAECDLKGKFNLYRLRLNNLALRTTDEEEGAAGETVLQKTAADFIDVSVPSKDDVELLHFWQYGRCVNIFEPTLGFWVTVPDLTTCVAELERILTAYESNTAKKEKREKKLAFLKSMLAGGA